VILDNEGWEYEVALDRVERSAVTGEILVRRRVASEPAVKMTLYQSLVKRDKFEWVLQKCTELGVTRFVPMITRHSVIQELGSISPKKVARWQRIITESAEQSRRGRRPDLGSGVTFRQAIDGLNEFQLAVISWEQEVNQNLRAALSSVVSGVPSIAIFIGPEGGFAEEEIDYARRRGVTPVTLGPRILRSETAAVVTSALILHEIGGLA
jgi:16S rRNA (uracil1498-N3)-methyltransferase